jgi:hypothetical protein
MPVCKGLDGILASTLDSQKPEYRAASGLKSEDNYYI